MKYKVAFSNIDLHHLRVQYSAHWDIEELSSNFLVLCQGLEICSTLNKSRRQLNFCQIFTKLKINMSGEVAEQRARIAYVRKIILRAFKKRGTILYGYTDDLLPIKYTKRQLFKASNRVLVIFDI